MGWVIQAVVIGFLTIFYIILATSGSIPWEVSVMWVLSMVNIAWMLVSSYVRPLRDARFWVAVALSAGTWAVPESMSVCTCVCVYCRVHTRTYSVCVYCRVHTGTYIYVCVGVWLHVRMCAYLCPPLRPWPTRFKSPSWAAGLINVSLAALKTHEALTSTGICIPPAGFCFLCASDHPHAWGRVSLKPAFLRIHRSAGHLAPSFGGHRQPPVDAVADCVVLSHPLCAGLYGGRLPHKSVSRAHVHQGARGAVGLCALLPVLRPLLVCVAFPLVEAPDTVG